MSQNLDLWDDAAPPDAEEEYEALQRAIRRNQGFGLLFVQCSPAEGKRVIERLRTDLPQKRMATLRFTDAIPDGNIYREIKAFLAEHKSLDVVFIQGLEHSLYAYEDTKRHLGWAEKEVRSYSWKGVPPVMVNLNQQRENFRDSFTTCFVFLIPLFAKNYLIHRAPDFFDWRSGIFELPVDQAELQQRSLSAHGDYDKYLKLTPAERIQKLAELRNLIDDPNQTLDRKVDLLREQGRVFAANQDYEEAIAAYDQALAIKPDYHNALYNKGVALADLGRYEEAIAAYDQALAIKPDYHNALSGKGFALANLGRHEEAIDAYDQALAIKPDYHNALSGKGFALDELGRYEEAIAAYDQALALKPDTYEALNNKGNALGNLGRYEEAIAAYDQALSLKPDGYEALNNKGNALDDLSCHEEAIAAYDQALALKPDYHEALYNKGNALRNLGRYEEAIAAYDQALAVKPDDHGSLNNKGVALRNLGRYEEAIAVYDHALAIKPNYVSTWYNKACCYGLQGNVEAAVETLKRTIELKSAYREMAQTDSDFDSIRDDEAFQALLNIF